MRKFPISVIYYGLDTETFTPRSKTHVRAALGIPENVSVIMFAAELMTVRRKGLGTLVEALKGITGETDSVLLSVGRRMPELSEINQASAFRTREQRLPFVTALQRGRCVCNSICAGSIWPDGVGSDGMWNASGGLGSRRHSRNCAGQCDWVVSSGGVARCTARSDFEVAARFRKACADVCELPARGAGKLYARGAGESVRESLSRGYRPTFEGSLER
jgi:hypothetical protein